jgi:hypothetical protein
LHWKGIAEKVLTAVANKATQAIMGGDMAELLKAIESDNIFGNRRSVRKAAH